MKTDKHAAGIASPILPIPTDLVQQGRPSQKIACILFDIYGTLFISGSGDIGIARAQAEEHQDMAGLLKKFNLSDDPEQVKHRFFSEIERTHRQMQQNSVDYPEVKIDMIWKKVLTLETIETARKFAEAYEMMVNPVYPMPGLREVLRKLKEHGTAMGIISNAQFYTPMLFTGFLGSDPVDLGFRPDLLFYSYQLGYAKPSMYMFQKAADALRSAGIPESRVVYLGNDMLNDMLPAKKAGFQTALFAGDKRSLRLRKDDPRVSGMVPDMVVTDLIQILDYI